MFLAVRSDWHASFDDDEWLLIPADSMVQKMGQREDAARYPKARQPITDVCAFLAVSIL